jgi:hypothetical protein
MEKFYGTFGCGQLNSGRCQVILAPDIKTATRMMNGIYGNKWSFMYTEEFGIKI